MGVFGRIVKNVRLDFHNGTICFEMLDYKSFRCKYSDLILGIFIHLSKSKLFASTVVLIVQ